ncbi:MAG: PadR family transcriptional regulator [Bacillota bacterium]
MSLDILRKISLAYMRIHILYHAGKEPFFGLWMIKELGKHGYQISSGTLYPILHNLENEGLLVSDKRVIQGKVRKYYSLTKKGNNVLQEIRDKTEELYGEILEEE